MRHLASSSRHLLRHNRKSDKLYPEWVRVTEWPAGGFVGTLEVQPVDVRGFSNVQLMRVVDTDVFERAMAVQQGWRVVIHCQAATEHQNTS